jgi:hypothetical protein
MVARNIKYFCTSGHMISFLKIGFPHSCNISKNFGENSEHRSKSDFVSLN